MNTNILIYTHTHTYIISDHCRMSVANIMKVNVIIIIIGIHISGTVKKNKNNSSIAIY